MNNPNIEAYRSRLDNAKGFSEVWEIVKDTVKDTLKEKRIGMMLFLDTLPLRIGAYHPIGTNNIVLNKALVNLVQAATSSKRLINAFVYTLLLHEYLHALGHIPESEVKNLVAEISKQCFGENHITHKLGLYGPWALLKGIPLDKIEAPKRVIEIVKDFEKENQSYIT